MPESTRSLYTARLPLFPLSTGLEKRPSGAVLAIAGLPLDILAERYGTPLYLYDQSTLDEAVMAYRQALQQYYPGEAGLTYAGKAFLCTALAQWALRRGLWLDCTGVGEMTIALHGGALRSSIVVHGVNKSPADLELALAQAGTIVVDHLDELQRLVELRPQAS